MSSPEPATHPENENDVQTASAAAVEDPSTELEEASASQPDAGEDSEAQAAHDHAGHNHDHAEPEANLNPECTRRLAVEVPAEKVSGAFARVVKLYRRQARIPGFRAGKVPESVIRRKFADAIRQDVLEELLPGEFRAAIERENVQPVSQPQVTSLHLVDGEPLRFEAAFETLPAIDVTGYQEEHVEKPDTELSDSEFEAELKEIREAHSTMETVEEDRPLTDGDFAQVRFSGKVNTEVAEGEESEAARPIQSDNADIEIGGENTVAAFSDALRGAKVGQQLELTVNYPEDFAEKRLAGKAVAYEIEVKGIRKKTLPEVDDAFAKQVGEFETADEFKQKLREHMARDKRRRLESEAKDKLLSGFIGRFQFPVPESLLQQQIDNRLERGLRALAAQGMSTRQMRELNLSGLRTQQREAALGEVKGSLILDRIAELEHVEIADDEFEGHLQILATQAREPLESFRKRLTEDGGLARIREQLRREKTINQLYDRLAA